MRIPPVDRKLATDETHTLQFPYHQRSFTNIVASVIRYDSSSNRKRKAHVTPIHDGLVKRQISPIPQTMQASTVIHKPCIKKMLPVVSIIWIHTVHKETKHLQSCAQIAQQSQSQSKPHSKSRSARRVDVACMNLFACDGEGNFRKLAGQVHSCEAPSWHALIICLLQIRRKFRTINIRSNVLWLLPSKAC